MLIHDVTPNSPEWFALRLGIPTASEFKNLITAKKLQLSITGLKTYAITLAGEKFAGKALDAFEGNKYTEWGHEHEDDARRHYRFDRNVEVSTIGFATTDDGKVGASPDSMVGEDGGLEIKCLQGQKHVESLWYIDEGTCPPDYRIQCQGQLFVTGWKWIDLFFFHPDLPKVSIRIEPDPVIQDLLAEQLEKLLTARDEIHTMLTRQDAL